jgi:hypothetical protein
MLPSVCTDYVRSRNNHGNGRKNSVCHYILWDISNFFYRPLRNTNLGPITPGMIAAHESILHMLKISKMLAIQALRKTLRK